MRLVDPVVKRPLLTEWSRVAASIVELIEKRDTLREGAKRTVDKVKFARARSAANEAEREAQKLFNGYLERLREFRVLVPACGSGNFLYQSLQVLSCTRKRLTASHTYSVSGQFSHLDGRTRRRVSSESSETGLPVMEKQLVDPGVQVGRQTLQDVLEVSPRVVPIEFGRLNQAHHRRRALASQLAAGEQQRLMLM